MNKIKVAGSLVFFLSIILVLLSTHINTKNRANSMALSFLNEQKAFTQEGILHLRFQIP
jgi:hypothetical protein